MATKSTRRSKIAADDTKLIDWDSPDFCRRCPSDLLDERMNCARGRMYQNAKGKPKVVIVGEAPGLDEIRQGRFFVGSAGQELERWLMTAGLDDQPIWLDNAVRCGLQAHLSKHEPKDVDRLIANCRPYLYRELDRLKPNVVVTLGNLALEALTGESGISRWRGRIIKHRELGCYLVPTYHPAAILRGNPSWRQDAIDDLQKASKLKARPKFKKRERVFVRTEAQFEKCMREMEASSAFVLDFETTGLDALSDETKLIGLALAASDSVGYFVPFMELHEAVTEQGSEIMWDQSTTVKPAWAKRLRKLIESKRLKIIQNAGFDMLLLSRLGWSCYPLFDTQIVNSIIDSIDNGLKSLAWLHTDFGGYESELESYFHKVASKKRNYASLPPALLADYAAFDGMATFGVYEAHKRMIGKSAPQLQWLIDEQNELRFNLTEMEFGGVELDVAHVTQLKDRYAKELVELEKQIRKVFKRKALNLRSNPELMEAFFGNEGMFDAHEYQIRKPSTEKKTLTKLKRALREEGTKAAQKKLDALNLFLTWRTFEKRVSTYLEPFLQMNGRAHPHFTQDVVRTGRLSSRAPNLQNQPRTPEMRNCFVARKGYKLVELDYKQLELCIAAELSKDVDMLRLLNGGEDIHSFVGHNTIMTPSGEQYPREVFETDKELRAKAKITGFSVIYGKTPFTLADDLETTVDRAAQIIALLVQHTFPGLGNWILEQQARVEQEGMVVTIFGRRIPIPNHDSLDDYELAEAHRKAVNYAIQSAASDCVVVGLNRVARKIRRDRQFDGVFLRLTVHDSLLAEVPDAMVPAFARMARTEMEKKISVVKRVKLRVDVKAGQRWGELEDLHL